MKKVFLSAIMMASVYTLCAQEVPTYRATDFSYGVPSTIQTNFQVAYPTITDATWQPMSDYWYATYKDNNNRVIQVYYNTQPYYLVHMESFKVALPVTNTLIPEDVISNAIHTYGNDLYSITALKTSGSNDMMYQVTLIKNGNAESVMMNGTGVAYNSTPTP